MAQILGVIMGAYFIWEGAKGFGDKGIKIGLLKADSEPITGTKGKWIGAFVILVGLVLLFYMLVYLPLMMSFA